MKSEMVERLTQPWDLMPSASPDIQRVTEKQVVIAKVRLINPFTFHFSYLSSLAFVIFL